MTATNITGFNLSFETICSSPVAGDEQIRCFSSLLMILCDLGFGVSSGFRILSVYSNM